jgi:hypothetical protein
MGQYSRVANHDAVCTSGLHSLTLLHETVFAVDSVLFGLPFCERRRPKVCLLPNRMAELSSLCEHAIYSALLPKCNETVTKLQQDCDVFTSGYPDQGTRYC